MRNIIFLLLFSLGLNSSLDAQNNLHLNQSLDLFYQSYVLDGMVDYGSINPSDSEFKAISKIIEQASLSEMSDNEKKSFLINAYNFLAIRTVLENQIPESVQDVSGFFNNKIIEIESKSYSLQNLEDYLYELEQDPRFHFALVCAAKSCPPLLNESFKSANLEEQLESITKAAINNPKFIRWNKDKSKAYISEIFRWYAQDFNQSGGIKSFINKYIDNAAEDFSFKYYTYNWSLNNSSNAIISTNSADRYFVSNLYQKGEYEVNLFQNYYSQKDKLNGSDQFNSRYNFNTLLFQSLFGISKRVNIGFDIRLRAVEQNLVDDSGLFSALNIENSGFQFENEALTGYTRAGISAIGLRLKYQPFKKIARLSFQHSIYFPTGDQLGGNNETGFLDWGSPVLINQVFYDKAIGTRFNLFLETGLHIENINGSLFANESGFNQVSTPSTVIYSYFPNSNWTIYGLLGYAPRWERSVGSDLQVNTSYNAFRQLGAGVKYLIDNKLEFEILFTDFQDKVSGRTAKTFNFGIRYFYRK